MSTDCSQLQAELWELVWQKSALEAQMALARQQNNHPLLDHYTHQHGENLVRTKDVMTQYLTHCLQ